MNRKARITVSAMLLAGGTIAFLFLMYSLVYLSELNMSWYQPRVIVEASIAVVLTALGFHFRTRPPKTINTPIDI